MMGKAPVLGFSPHASQSMLHSRASHNPLQANHNPLQSHPQSTSGTPTIQCIDIHNLLYSQSNSGLSFFSAVPGHYYFTSTQNSIGKCKKKGSMAVLKKTLRRGEEMLVDPHHTVLGCWFLMFLTQSSGLTSVPAGCDSLGM